MLRLITTLSFASLLITANSFATEITLTTPDNFTLKADYYPSKSSSNSANNHAVLMLHQCNYNRTMYDNIGEQLAQQSIHALSLDFRGFGESTNSEFNVTNIRKLPQKERSKAWSDMSSHWPKDVQIAFDYLKDKVGSKGKVGVIGASCGGNQAITLAEKESISAISFFSSSQRDENIARYGKTLVETPTLIIASEDDGRTYTSAQQLFSIAKHPDSKMISYKGNMHGYPLLDSDIALEKTIVTWFASELKK
jgi:dienelactone hydrolase